MGDVETELRELLRDLVRRQIVAANEGDELVLYARGDVIDDQLRRRLGARKQEVLRCVASDRLAEMFALGPVDAIPPYLGTVVALYAIERDHFTSDQLLLYRERVGARLSGGRLPSWLATVLAIEDVLARRTARSGCERSTPTQYAGAST